MSQNKGVRPPKFTLKTWARLIREMKADRDAQQKKPACCPLCSRPLTE